VAIGRLGVCSSAAAAGGLTVDLVSIATNCIANACGSCRDDPFASPCSID